jgi:hypothetical protein
MAKAMIGCFATFMVLALLLPVLVCALSPDLENVIYVLLPLNSGYSKIFGISDRWSTFFALPGMISTSIGFFFIGAKQLTAMGKSGYIPVDQCCCRNPQVMVEDDELKDYHENNASIQSYAIVLALCFLVNLISLIPNATINFLDDFLMLTLVGSFCVYMWSFLGYAVYKSKYCRERNGFRNPFGLCAAALGFVIFLVALISVVGFAYGGNYRLALYYLGYISLMSVVFYFYSSTHLRFSKEEQKAMFGAYVIKGTDADANALIIHVLVHVLIICVVTAANKARRVNAKKPTMIKISSKILIETSSFSSQNSSSVSFSLPRTSNSALSK